MLDTLPYQGYETGIFLTLFLEIWKWRFKDSSYFSGLYQH